MRNASVLVNPETKSSSGAVRIEPWVDAVGRGATDPDDGEGGVSEEAIDGAVSPSSPDVVVAEGRLSSSGEITGVGRITI